MGAFDYLPSDDNKQPAGGGAFSYLPAAAPETRHGFLDTLKATGANMAAGVNRASGEVLDFASRQLSHVPHDPTADDGSIRQGLHEGAIAAREGADYWEKVAKESGQDPNSVMGQVYQGVGGAPMGVAKFVTNVPGAVVEAADKYQQSTQRRDGGDNAIVSAVKGGAERFATGKVFHAIENLPVNLLSKTAAMTGVMTGQAAVEPGATPKSVATAAITGGLLSMQGGGEQEVVRQRLIRGGTDPKVAAELASRSGGVQPVDTSTNYTEWEQHPGHEKDVDLLHNPEELPSATDEASRPTAAISPVRDSENAPGMQRNRMAVGIEGEGAPEATSAVANEGVEVREPANKPFLTENQETVPPATDMSTIQPVDNAERNPEQIPGRTMEGPSLENPQNVGALNEQVRQHNEQVKQQEQAKVDALAAKQKAEADAAQFIGDRKEQTIETPQGKVSVKWKKNKEGQIEVTTVEPTANGKVKSSKVMSLPELADYLKSRDKVTQEQYLEHTNGENTPEEKAVQPTTQENKPAVSAPEGNTVGGKQTIKENENASAGSTTEEAPQVPGDQGVSAPVDKAEAGTPGGDQPATPEEQEVHPERHYIETAYKRAAADAKDYDHGKQMIDGHEAKASWSNKKFIMPWLDEPTFDNTTPPDVVRALEKASKGERLGKVQKLIVERAVEYEKELDRRDAESKLTEDVIDEYIDPADLKTANELRTEYERSTTSNTGKSLSEGEKDSVKESVRAGIDGEGKANGVPETPQRDVPTGERQEGGRGLQEDAANGAEPEVKLLHAGLHIPEAVKQFAQLPGIKETVDSIKRFFNISSLMSEESRTAMHDLMGSRSKAMNQMKVMAQRAMKGRSLEQMAEDFRKGTMTIARKAAQLTRDEQVRFQDKVRTGDFENMNDTEKKILAIGGELDNQWGQAIRKLFPAFPLRDNHFMMTMRFKGAEEEEYFPSVSSRLEGDKGFTKGFSGKTVSQIEQSGMEAVETDPWKVMQQSWSDHTKFLSAATMMRNAIDSGRWMYRPKGDPLPEGMTQVPDKVGRVFKQFLNPDETEAYYPKSFNVLDDMGGVVKKFPDSETARRYAEANGHMKTDTEGVQKANVEMKVGKATTIEAGQWYMPKDEAVALERYLERDKVRNSPIGKALMEMKNMDVSVELYGFFHYATVGKESISNRFGIAATKFMSGDYKGAGQVLKPGTASGIFGLWRGALDNHKNLDTPEAQETLKRLGMDKDTFIQMQDELYKSGAKIEDSSDHETVIGSYINKKYESNLVNMPVAAVRMTRDAVMIPLDYLFKEYVPNLKTTSLMMAYDTNLKLFADRIASGEMTREEVARRTVVHHDNVFGQLNYDSLMIPKAFKTTLQIALRAPGWQLGNIRSVVNAFRYQSKEFARAAEKGQAPVLTPEMSWMVSTMAVHMIEAGLIGFGMAALTGDDRLKPTQFSDWLFPKVSAITKVMPPGYVKDWAAMSHGFQTNPRQFIENFVVSKMAGSWSRAWESWRNRDYYGTQVWDPHGNPLEKTYDVIKHEAPVPIMAKSAKAEKQTGETSPVIKIMSLFGYNKVPGWVENSAAYTTAQGFKSTQPARTKEEKAHSDLIRSLSGQYINDQQKGAEAIVEAVKDNKLSKRDLQTIKNHIQEPPLLRLFKPLTAMEALDVWEVSTPEERAMLTKSMSSKLRSLGNKTPEEREAAFKRWSEITKGDKSK